MKYLVRDQFVIKQGREFFHGGDVIELSDEEAQNWLHAIEPAEKPAAPAPKKAKAAAEAEGDK